MTYLRPGILASGVLLVLALAGCTSGETKDLLDRNQALGSVVAEETARIAGSNKKVVVILPQWGTVCSVEESLQSALKKKGVTITATIPVNVGDPMRREALGLKSADFSSAIEKAAGTGAIVSLAGAPLVQPQEAASLSPGHPPVIVVATASLGNVMGLPGDRAHLASLLEAKIVQLAFIDGTDADAQPPAKADAVHQTFAKNYILLRRPD